MLEARWNGMLATDRTFVLDSRLYISVFISSRTSTAASVRQKTLTLAWCGAASSVQEDAAEFGVSASVTAGRECGFGCCLASVSIIAAAIETIVASAAAAAAAADTLWMRSGDCPRCQVACSGMPRAAGSATLTGSVVDHGSVCQ